MCQSLVLRRRPDDLPKVGQRDPLDHQTRTRPIEADQLDPGSRGQRHASDLQELPTRCRKGSSRWSRFVQSSLLRPRQGINGTFFCMDSLGSS